MDDYDDYCDLTDDDEETVETFKDIKEEYKEEHKLDAIKQATMNNNHEQLLELLKAYKIKSRTTGLTEAVRPEILSLHKNVLLVNDRIWVPKNLIPQFCTNLHIGHRSSSTMLTLARRSCYWKGMK